MRLRIFLVSMAILVSAALASGVCGSVARADVQPENASGPQSPNSVFLWQNPIGHFIVVLGAKMGTHGETPNILNERLDVAAQLARTHPANRVIVSGGNTWWLPVSEAQFMNVGLMKRGVPMWQMVNEGTSTSTVQNATNTVGMLKAMGATGAVIVTNGFHMPRALGDFRAAAKDDHANLEFRTAVAG
ncbi:YdcF family protein [Gordonia sp. DT30]|uniref:YdcF family protein n=1 Tax=unclassified Gordonia (in: high G+C Gram-positive bacteria) TaxID=2657482 RepID=UPI003CEB20C0